MSSTDPWFDLNNPSIAAASGAYVSGMTINGINGINGMTTMLPPPPPPGPTMQTLYDLLDHCRTAGHTCAMTVDEASGAVTVTHEDPTAPRESGAMEMFDINPLDYYPGTSVGKRLLAFLGRMHGDPTPTSGWRRREGYAPPHVGAARDAREPLSAADLMVGPDDL